MRLYTFNYDETFHPAMPVAEVVFIEPNRRQESPQVKAIVDSGSDSTSLPIALMDELKALNIGTAYMSGIWGERRVVDIFLVSVKIGSHVLHGIRVAGIPDTNEVILGRNVLNHIPVKLNGPAHMVEISED